MAVLILVDPLSYKKKLKYSRIQAIKHSSIFFLLSHQDSNLGKQNQNLMCYHYTMGQSLSFSRKSVQKYAFFPIWPNLFSIRLRINFNVRGT